MRSETGHRHPHESELRRLVVDVGDRMWLRGMVAANDGNISVRLRDGTILCTPTGASKRVLTEDMLPVVTVSGDLVREGTGHGPSSEIKMHLRIYERAPWVQAVVHAHPPYATAFAIAGEALSGDIMTETALSLPEVPLAPFATPSTEEVPDSIEPFIQDHRACLLEFHGALTWGTSLEDAYLTMERIEALAQTRTVLRSLGSTRQLGEARVAELRGKMAATPDPL